MLPKKLSPKKARLQRRNVGVLVDFSRAYGRKVLLGVAKYLREHHEWSVQCEEWRWTDAAPKWLETWKGDGIIAWVETPELADVLAATKRPVVDVRGSLPDCLFPKVIVKNQAVSALAAKHLLDRGFHHFAFCGFVGANYSDQRSQFFEQYLHQRGFRCTIYDPPAMARSPETKELEKRGLLFQDHLDRWLEGLPKPVGIMACNDIRGQQVMNACRRRDFAIPDQIAIISVDNDEVFCELSDPPLTSVALDTTRIGYEAADVLARMMRGAASPTGPILIPPLGVISRRSTEILPSDHPRLASAQRYLREHAFEPERVSVNNLARVAGMSRRIFERRFVQHTGRSPKEEIIRLRLDRVKELLVNTDWTLARIASQTGFNYAEYLHAVFREKIGITPGKYRQAVKPSALQRGLRTGRGLSIPAAFES